MMVAGGTFRPHLLTFRKCHACSSKIFRDTVAYLLHQISSTLKLFIWITLFIMHSSLASPHGKLRVGQNIANYSYHYQTPDMIIWIVEYPRGQWLIMKYNCYTFRKHALICRYLSHFYKRTLKTLKPWENLVAGGTFQHCFLLLQKAMKRYKADMSCPVRCWDTSGNLVEITNYHQ